METKCKWFWNIQQGHDIKVDPVNWQDVTHFKNTEVQMTLLIN